MKYKIVTCFALFLFIFSNVFADHILGGTLGYKFISSSGETSVYKVTLELYVTCKLQPSMGSPPNPLTNSPQVVLLKDGVKYAQISLQFISSLSDIDITPVCPDYRDSTSCRDPNNDVVDGIRKYTYNADVTIEGTDENWVFNFYGRMTPDNTRDNAEIYSNITNVDAMHVPTGPPPIYDIMYLVATLNNTKGPNSTPTFTAPPIPFFCTGKQSYYGFGAADEDNNDLKFKLIPGRQVLFINYQYYAAGENYIAPYTGEKPIHTAADSFYFNPDNGQMIFRPDQDMINLVVAEIDEYKDGVLVGSSMRQMCFFVYDQCNAEAANTTLGNVTNADYNIDAEGNLYLSTCEGFTDTVDVTINVSDPNNDNVTVTSDNIPNAAHVTVGGNGTQHPVVHFKWFLTDALPGTYFFYLTYTDDGCPIASQKNVAYTFTIVPHNITFSSGFLGSCADSANGKAWIVPIGENTIDYEYKWEDSQGNVLRDVHSSNGDTIRNIPVDSYKIYVRNEHGCGPNIFITIDTTPPPTVILPNDSTVCEGMPIAIGAKEEPRVSYKWNTGQDSYNIVATQTGTFALTAQNQCGITTDSIHLDFVKCNYCLFIPNAFSPNGDGDNDIFRIIPTCLFRDFKIQIFNRFGQLVYVSYSLNDSWNGTFKNKEADLGTYFYNIKADYEDRSKGTFFEKGEVILLR